MRDLTTCSVLIEAENHEDVRAELERILASDVLADSARLKQFLRYVVDETLAGRANRLKGFTVAQDVFGKSDAEDPENNAVVRVEAGRLRRRLAEYYAGAGRANPVRISIPKGAYVPAFEKVHENTARSSPTNGVGVSTGTRHSWAAIWPIVISALVVVAIATYSWRTTSQQENIAELTTSVTGPSIAVMPFVDQSRDGIGAALATGLTEDIITDLSKLTSLDVISYASVAQFTDPSVDPLEISNRLKVEYVLRGSVRGITAAKLRVTAQLYEAGTGRALWTDRFDRDPADLLSVQDELANLIADGLSTTLENRVVVDRH